MKFIIVALAATAVALTAAPALAKSKKPRIQHPHYGQAYYPGWQGGGWVSAPVGLPINRPFSDPSNVSPGYLQAKALGRCVEDLGYGRYRYCN